MKHYFKDRADAGRQLAARLAEYAGRDDVLVLALPRGGVVIGYEVACALHLPLDVLTVRKLGLPGQEELAMGAIASGGLRVMNEQLVDYLSLTPEEIERVAEREIRELERRERLYRGSRPMPDLAGKTILLVDDGIATGTTMRAAVALLRGQQPARLVIAAPVAAQTGCDEFGRDDERETCVCLLMPESFVAVGYWYGDFTQTTDDEVRELLARAAQNHARSAHQ